MAPMNLLDFATIMNEASHPRVNTGPYTGTRLVMAACLLATLSLSGCTNPEPEPPELTVETVEAYDVTLDEDATPKQVGYVLLRALRDDVLAAQEGKRKEQREAHELAFRLSAPTLIGERIPENQVRAAADPDQERDARIFDITYHWAPIVAHYIESFPTDLAEARARFELIEGQVDNKAYLTIPLTHNPDASDPADRGEVTLKIELFKETAGEKTFWRVARLSYVGTAPATAPTS